MVESERKMDKSKYDTDRLAQSSYGYSDEQLLEWMELAESRISDKQIPRASEKDYKYLETERKRRENILYFENSTKCLKSLLKVATVMAILGSVLVITSTAAGQKNDHNFGDKSSAGMPPYVVMNDESKNEIEEVFMP